MHILYLQRKLILHKNRIQRTACLAAAATALCSALMLQLQIADRPDTANIAGRPPERLIAETEQEPRLEPSEEEMDLLARAVYSEARGEKFDGQVAVAAVILNRIADPKFPNNVAGVIFQPQAFTAVSDGQFWLEPNQTAFRAAETALEGKDPTLGALYYYNPAKATSWWIFTRPIITRIGRHVFAE